MLISEVRGVNRIVNERSVLLILQKGAIKFPEAWTSEYIIKCKFTIQWSDCRLGERKLLVIDDPKLHEIRQKSSRQHIPGVIFDLQLKSFLSGFLSLQISI